MFASAALRVVAVLGVLLALKWSWESVFVVDPSPDLKTVPAAELQLDDWRAVFRGVDFVKLSTTHPRRMVGYAVRVRLDEPGVRFVATPSNGDRPLETDGLRTSTFLESLGCQVAINAAPFQPMHSRENRPHNIQGLHVSRGEVVSAADDYRYPALLITREKRAAIASPPFDLDGIETAVAGFSMALDAGRAIDGSGVPHPRVGAGVSRDGRFVYLLAIDGRQSRYSDGATRGDLGRWLALLGAWDGINLDGGGTATMAIEEARGQARVVNRPIHNGTPGRERVSGSHLGVLAQPVAPAAADL